MSDERHEIILREADGPNPQGILQELKTAIEELFPIAKDSAGKYISGKADAEVAKAAEIKARAIAALGQLELESQRLIAERDAAEQQAENDRLKAEFAHEERMYELRTQRFKELVEAAKTMKELGIDVEPMLTKVMKDLAAKPRGPKRIAEP